MGKIKTYFKQKLKEIVMSSKIQLFDESELDSWENAINWVEVELKDVSKRSYLPNETDAMVLFIKNFADTFGEFSYDTATGRMFWENPKTGENAEIRTDQEMSAIITPIRVNLSRNVFKFNSNNKQFLYQLVKEVAYTNAFNSQQERLEDAYDFYKEHKKDKFRLGTYENVNENLLKWQFNQQNEFDNKQMRFWLALVARHIMEPFQHGIDFTLPIISTNESMSSAQGAGKTTFLRWLAYNDAVDLDGFSTESWRKAGHAFMLIDDEAKLLKASSVEHYKSAITKNEIAIRYPYEPTESLLPMRYTMITANENFLKDNTGNRRFPIIELTDISGREMVKEDWTDELRMAIWGQAMNDYKSGWLDENYSEMYDALTIKVADKRELTEEEEALFLYVRYTDDAEKLAKTDPIDLIDYVTAGVPNVDEPVDYVFRSNTKAFMDQLFNGKVTTNKMSKLLAGLDEHYLNKLPAKGVTDLKATNPSTGKQDRLYKRRDLI